MNRWPRIVIAVFLVVCLGALVGMTFGGVFGHWAGQTAPDFFKKILAFRGNDFTTEPMGTATMMGAAGGAVLGGLLAVFGVLVAMFTAWLRTREKALSNSHPPAP